MVQSDPQSLEQGQSFSGVTCLGQALYLAFLEFFAAGDFSDKVVDTGESLGVVIALHCSKISLIIRVEALSLFKFVSNLLIFLDVQGSFDGSDGF